MTGNEDLASPVSAAPFLAKKTKKRAPPVFIPTAAKRRRAAVVRRTHSPKTVPSPSSTPLLSKKVSKSIAKVQGTEVRRVAPTLKGVREAARLLSNGTILVIPTETVYTCCTSIEPSDQEQSSQQFKDLTSLRKSVTNEQPASAYIRGPSDVARIFPMKRRLYAVKESGGGSSPPACFHEGEEVLKRLSRQLWPGPTTICLRVPDDTIKLPTEIVMSFRGQRYLRLMNPSHPLAVRLLKEMGDSRIVVGVPACLKNGHFITSAIDACRHFLSQPPSQKIIHVLNGEDRRELFSVPTCQYKEPYCSSLLVDDRERIVHICGRKDLEGSCSENSLTKVLFANSRESSPSFSPEKKQSKSNRNRVVTAVMRQWRVVDQRTDER